MLRAYEAYEKKPNSQDECGFGERGGIIVCGLLPPPRGGKRAPLGLGD